jgi:hypothetical protein
VQGAVPLQIKLQLERLRLVEVISAEAAHKARQGAVQPAEEPAAAYAMT